MTLAFKATGSASQPIPLGGWVFGAGALHGDHLARSHLICSSISQAEGSPLQGLGSQSCADCLVGGRLFIPLAFQPTLPLIAQALHPGSPPGDWLSLLPAHRTSIPAWTSSLLLFNTHLLCRFLSQAPSPPLGDAITFSGRTLAPKLLRNTTDQIPPLLAQLPLHSLVSP